MAAPENSKLITIEELLNQQSEKRQDMKAQQILNAVQEQKNVKTIGCIFTTTQYAQGHEKIYTYKTWLDHQIGDSVVVLTAKGYKVVEVVEVHEQSQIDGTSTIEYKWIVAIVDHNHYQAKTILDEEAIVDINNDLRKQASKTVLDQVSENLLKRL